jgi:cyclopropane-fatty-acyl-phospholipid synthase
MSLADRLARRLVLRVLRGTRGGELQLLEGGERLVFGHREPERPLVAVVQVHSPRFYRSLLRGSVGLAESYMDGAWDCADLVGLVRLAALNVRWLDRLRKLLSPVLIPLQRWLRWVKRNTVGRARRQIAAHYDLGNELFALFLDPTMMYSCAIFESPSATLQEASLAKLERVCSKLALAPEDHVLEIGTGWGGFAVYAAERYGCQVTTTTISREQHAYASERVRAAGLEDRVTVLLEDYRSLEGRFDKLVSIEMIEAVGWQYFGTYFRRCSELLADDGAMLLQAITIDDRAYSVEKASKSFINTYIFPGGCLPSLEVISRAVSRMTDLRQVHLEDITAHYAETLARWRERFIASSERLRGLGYDDRFRRLWELYLCYCEAGFRERRIQDVQVLLAKPGYRAEPLPVIAAAGSPVGAWAGGRSVTGAGGSPQPRWRAGGLLGDAPGMLAGSVVESVAGAASVTPGRAETPG